MRKKIGRKNFSVYGHKDYKRAKLRKGMNPIILPPAMGK